MTMNAKSIFALAILLSFASMSKATDGLYTYTSDFKSRLIVNIQDKEIVIVDALLEFGTCGKSCIRTENLALAVVKGPEKRVVGDTEFKPREGSVQRLLGEPCSMIDVYKSD